MWLFLHVMDRGEMEEVFRMKRFFNVLSGLEQGCELRSMAILRWFYNINI